MFQQTQIEKKSRAIVFACILFTVSSRVFVVEQFGMRRWKANKKTNLMISKHLKSDDYSLRNSELWLKESKSWRKALCALYNTYLVTPIPCYLLQAAWLVRFRNCPYPQPYSRAKECYEAAWSKTPKRAAWVRVKWTHCILFDLCVFKPQLMSIWYAA